MLLQYDFRVVGADRVHHALRGIESRFVEHNAKVGRATRAAGMRPGTSGDADGRRAIAASRLADNEIERRNRHMHQEHMRRLRERSRAEQHVARVRQRHFAQQQREEERAERQSISARQSFRRATVGTAGRSVMRSTRALGTMGASALAIGGSLAATGAVSSEMDLNKRIATLLVNSRAPGAEFTSTKEEVRGAVMDTALATGRSRSDVTAGLEMFVRKTGDLKGGMENLKMFGTIATAFDASTEDIASAAASLKEQFNVESAKDLAELISTLGAQGRKAAFELKAMASHVEKLGAAGKRFGLAGADDARLLGGLTQIAQTATGGKNGDQAAFAVEATLRQLISKSRDIQSGKAFGKRVQVFEGGDETAAGRNLRDLIPDILAASGGNKVKLQKVFGEEGIRAMSPFISAFNDARRAAGGGKAGEQAGRDAVTALLSGAIDAPAAYADVQKDAAVIAAESSAQLSNAFEKLTSVVGSELEPVVVRLVNKLSENVDSIGKLADGIGHIAEYLIANPLKGIGTLIAGKVLMDIAAASIGAKISALIVAQTAAGGGATSLTGAIMGGGSLAAAGGLAGKAGVIAKGAARAGGIAAMAAGVGYLAKKGGDTFLEMLDPSYNADDAGLGTIKEAWDRTDGLGDFWDKITNWGGPSVAEAMGREPGSDLTFTPAEAREMASARDREGSEKLLMASDKHLEAAAAQKEAAIAQKVAADRIIAMSELNRGSSPVAPR